MANPVSAGLGYLLTRAIIVGAVLGSMRLIWEGAFMVASGLILVIAMFLYLLWADPVWLR